MTEGQHCLISSFSINLVSMAEEVVSAYNNVLIQKSRHCCQAKSTTTSLYHRISADVLSRTKKSPLCLGIYMFCVYIRAIFEKQHFDNSYFRRYNVLARTSYDDIFNELLIFLVHHFIGELTWVVIIQMKVRSEANCSYFWFPTEKIQITKHGFHGNMVESTTYNNVPYIKSQPWFFAVYVHQNG